jgi:imidazolonepropionase
MPCLVEYKGRADAYIDEVCIPGLEAGPQGEGLVDAVDGFCEGIAFSPGTDCPRVRQGARANLVMPVKLHAEQLSNLGGAQSWPRSYGALSADHLEYANGGRRRSKAMAAAGTVAVIRARRVLHVARKPRRRQWMRFRKHGVPMAVATDCNPGSSPMTSLLLAMNMACTLFRMTPEEALAGVTRNAAKALGLNDHAA